MPIKAIIFDLFDVLLLTEDLTARYAYEQRMGLAKNDLLHVMLHSSRFKEAVTGNIESRFIACAQAIGMHRVLFKDSQQAIAEIQRCLTANR